MLPPQMLLCCFSHLSHKLNCAFQKTTYKDVPLMYLMSIF